MKPITKAMIVILFAFITGCQYDPYAGESTTNKPRLTDVIGMYKFKEQTVYDSPINKKAYSSTILLKPDGTFEANSIPDLMSNGVSNKLQDLPLISAKGKWEMDIVGSVDNSLWTKKHWGIRLTTLPESLSAIGFMGDSPPYQLIVTYDDPDLGQVMIFSKK